MVYFIHHWKRADSYIFWRKKFFSNSINISFTLCINQFPFFKIFYFIFLQTFLLICLLRLGHWTVESSVSPLTLDFEFLIFEISWMFWMLVTMKDISHGVTWITCILKTLVTQTFFWYVQWSWSHAFWLLNNKIFLKILLVARPENRTRKKRKKKNKNSNCKSFRVKRKHKTPNEKSMAQPYIKPVSRILEKDTICGKKVWILNSELEYTILPKFYVIS